MIILQTFGGMDYELTVEQVEKIRDQSTLGKTGGFWIGKDYISFNSIRDIVEIKKDHNPYHSLSEAHKIISKEKRNELLLKGLRRVRPEATMEDILNFISPDKKIYEPKYKTWEEAKAAGVV